jgi:glutamate-1-semialdehyde 2,1-aminomutase
MKGNDYLDQYRARTPNSRKLFERAVKVMPGGVSHRYRYMAPYPFFMKDGKGARIWDVDGNEYIDLWMGHYALIFGHQSQIFKEAMAEVAGLGTHWGILHEHEVRFAEAIQETLPCAEKLIFGVSGTEATMYAVRMARAFTGRSTILKMQGGWHGANSELLWAVRSPYDIPETRGLAPGLGRYTRAMELNDTEAALRIIHEVKEDLAGVIIEPVMGGAGFLPAEPGFLEMLREETRRLGALLILDEVITGYRLALGGAQQYFGIKPDLATIGKVAGGGGNLGVVAGRADILNQCDATAAREKGTGVLVGGGTFSCSPLTMLLGSKTLAYLKTHSTDVYGSIARRGEKLRQGVVEALGKHGINAKATGIESLFGLYFPYDPALTVRSPAQMSKMTDEQKVNLEFRIRMLNHGVFVIHGGGAVSTAHTDKDIEQIIAAAEEVAREMADQ